MKPLETIAVVGVGLIGGSIGLAARQHRLAREIVGIGRRESSLRKAKKRGAIDRATMDLERGVSDADLIIVCTPVSSIVPLAERIAAACPPHALITDAGSTKHQIVSALDRALTAAPKSRARRPRFVGSHPLAGDHRSGPEHARGDLFRDRLVVVTPSRKSRPGDVTKIKRFWSQLGSRVTTMTPQEHDRALAATSHLPHLVASAVVAATPEACLPLVASGWLDVTRVAASDPTLWRDIAFSNRQPILQALARMERAMSSVRSALESERPKKLEELLSQARDRRHVVGS